MREKFGKMFGFKDDSPYKGLLKERKIKEKKPHVQGETLGLKIKNIIQDVITTAGNPVSFFNTMPKIKYCLPFLSCPYPPKNV